MKPFRAADLFAGAGGASSALFSACAEADRRLSLIAVNHWPRAIETHSANHPSARHFCESVDSVNPRDAVPEGHLDLLMAGPECTHHSTARGGKPVNDQSRASAWCILRWATALTIDRILIENVPEFASWAPLGCNGRPLVSRKGETFQAFLTALRALGYRTDYRVFNSADYGDPTTRRRLFIQAVRGRRPIRWPDPTHCRDGKEDLFGQRPRWRAARSVIDWTNKGASIFGRKRPLSANTIRRIAAGLERFGGLKAFVLGQQSGAVARSVDEPIPTVAGKGAIALLQPFIVPTNYGERPGQRDRCHSIDAPLPTVTGSDSHAVVQPFILQMSQSGSNGHRSREVGEPLPTITTADDLALIEPFIVPAAHGDNGYARCHSIDEPLPTVLGSNAHALVQPFVVSLRGTREDQIRHCNRSVDEPLPTIAAQAGHLGLAEPFVVNYHGNGRAYPLTDPLPTVDTRDRYGLVLPEGMDILFRMLTPGELARAMSFPEGYRFCGTRHEVVKQIGNAWAGECAKALCREMIA